MEPIVQYGSLSGDANNMVSVDIMQWLDYAALPYIASFRGSVPDNLNDYF